MMVRPRWVLSRREGLWNDQLRARCAVQIPHASRTRPPCGYIGPALCLARPLHHSLWTAAPCHHPLRPFALPPGRCFFPPLRHTPSSRRKRHALASTTLAPGPTPQGFDLTPAWPVDANQPQRGAASWKHRTSSAPSFRGDAYMRSTRFCTRIRAGSAGSGLIITQPLQHGVDPRRWMIRVRDWLRPPPVGCAGMQDSYQLADAGRVHSPSSGAATTQGPPRTIILQGPSGERDMDGASVGKAENAIGPGMRTPRFRPSCRDRGPMLVGAGGPRMGG